jgi:hypothetical protein
VCKHTHINKCKIGKSDKNRSDRGSLLMGEGPHWTVLLSKKIKKIKKKNVSGSLIIVVQMNGIRKFSHDRHVDVPYCIKVFRIF